MEIDLQRLPTLCARLGLARPTIYKKIAAGLLPPPIKIGETSAWPSNETDAVIAAQIRGATDDELRKLVAGLVASRSTFGLDSDAPTRRRPTNSAESAAGRNGREVPGSQS